MIYVNKLSMEMVLKIYLYICIIENFKLKMANQFYKEIKYDKTKNIVNF